MGGAPKYPERPTETERYLELVDSKDIPKSIVILRFELPEDNAMEFIDILSKVQLLLLDIGIEFNTGTDLRLGTHNWSFDDSLKGAHLKNFTAEKLWTLLDDIDTSFDIMKPIGSEITQENVKHLISHLIAIENICQKRHRIMPWPDANDDSPESEVTPPPADD